MRKIFYIARNELYSLIYSPIAWFIMIIFIVMVSGYYIDNFLDFMTGASERGGFWVYIREHLTFSGLAGYGGDFGFTFYILRNIYLFLPLVTMGLISRETSSGTIKLLYSSPLHVYEIVFGKFLAMVFYNLILCGLMLMILTGFMLSINQPDYGFVAVNLFAIFLVFCAYAAIGLFVSSLTSYQVVAAVITFALFLLFTKIGGMWQDVEVLKSISFYLDINHKSSNLMHGLLNLRDMVYILLIVSLFVSLTILKLKSTTESVSRGKNALRYLTVIAAAFIVGYFTSLPSINAYTDITRYQLNTITPKTREALGKLNDGPLEVHVYSNLFGRFSRFHPNEQNGLNTFLWEKYIRFKPDMTVTYKYYYNVTDTMSGYYKGNRGKSLKQIAQQHAKSFHLDLDRFMDSAEVNKEVDTRAEECRDFFLFKYKGKTAVVRTFDDMEVFPNEINIAAALYRLAGIPLPKISFLTDEIERLPFASGQRDVGYLTRLGNRAALINQGFDVDTLSLKNNAIPKGLAGIVIADPRTPFTKENLAKITGYIASGGNLLIATEPDRSDVVRPLLESLGLSLRIGLLIQPTEKLSSDVILAHMSDSVRVLTADGPEYFSNVRESSGDSVFKVALKGANVLEYLDDTRGFTRAPMLFTDSSKSWNRIAFINDDSLQLKMSRRPNDEQGRFITSVRLTRMVGGKQQRIFVTTDADYLSSFPARGVVVTHNLVYIAWPFSTFTYGEYPPNTSRPKTVDNSFRIGSSSIGTQKLIYYWIIPGIIGIVASILLIRRKRK